MLLRDISELRRRDRLLLSKDATIREIHHRVKNNLQTISSLLRLQGRRLSSPEAKAAIEESVRRIRSIALVHETLSHDAGDDVPFLEIVRPLVRMVEEGLISPDRPIRFKVVGDAGILPAAVATPLAVVLTELLQNVVDHAYPDGPGDGATVIVVLENDGRPLRRDGQRRRGRDRRRASRSRPPPAWACRSCARSSPPSSAGRSSSRRGDGPPGRPGTVVHLSVPVHT